MIKASKVSLRYPDGTLALKDVDIHINQGEMVFLTGPSGSGKTSLLKLFLGMEYPTGGSLTIMGKPMEKLHKRDMRYLRRNIGPVFQEFKLIEGRSALENVMTGMRFLGSNPKKIKEEAYEALVKVGLEDKIKSKVENLSWGQQQRVAIARAVARKPAIILADEPTGNLDKDNALHILNLLKNFKDHNTTVIITTHATHLIEGGQGVTHLHMDNGSITVERKEIVE
ncbi:MAG TPA: ATP-binding cassette domain-containing protein [Clostridiales bacterium]|nr:ATP-binding cassette domain-containing protein [Clostridiales bacterium]